MPIKEFSTSEYENQHIFGLIVGSSGAGKTTCVKTLKNSETLVISAESGLLSLKDVDYKVWSVSSIGDIQEAVKRLAKGVEFKTIFIDSLTEIGEIVFNELKPQFSKSQTFTLYEKYSELMVMLIKTLRDMSAYNIWLTALDRENEAGSVGIDLVQRSLAKKVTCFFDMVFYLKAVDGDDGKPRRVFLTDNSLIDFCKCRGNFNNTISPVELPDLGAITGKILKEE